MPKGRRETNNQMSTFFDNQESDLIQEFLTEYWEEFEKFAGNNGFDDDLLKQISMELEGRRKHYE
ncbi:hypothetical protein HMPREF2711_09835 [Neisseria sp. HMSC070A01]|nr:hypothetical protein HMPREF2711_09835 [Neisseria sp. HMSC070A01]